MRSPFLVAFHVFSRLLSFVACLNITIHFEDASNHFLANNVVINEETFDRGQLYQTYQGVYVVLNNGKFLISPTGDQLFEETLEVDGDVTTFLGDYFLMKAVVDLESCVLDAYNGLLKAINGDPVVEGVYLEDNRTAWERLWRIIEKDYWPPRFMKQFLKPSVLSFRNCLWTEHEEADTMYGISTCLWKEPCDSINLDVELPQLLELAEPHIHGGNVRGAVVVGSGNYISACVQYYHKAWEEKSYSPCPAGWCGDEHLRNDILRKEEL